MATLHIDPLPRNATPGEVLRFVAGTGNLDGKKVGKITFLGPAARVEVPVAHATKLVAALDGATFRERPVRVRLADAPRRAGPADHFDHLARLLQLEAEAERQQFRDRAARGAEAGDGTSLTKLLVIEEDAGLGGRLILTIGSVNRGSPLPPNRLQPGAPVVLTQTGTNRPASLRGVVSDRTERTVSVAFEQPDQDLPDDATWRLDLSPDEASRQRQLAALARAGAADGDRLAELRAVLLGE